jgi:CBS domain-containing protein
MGEVIPHHMAVLDVARREVVTHAPEETVADALASMREHAVGSVVLVDEDDRPTGIVTDRIVAMAVAADAGADGDLRERRLEELPTDPVDPVDASTGIYDLLEHMAEQGAQRVTVVEDGALAGIISISDVVVLLGMELQHVANVVRTAGPAYVRGPTDVYE